MKLDVRLSGCNIQFPAHFGFWKALLETNIPIGSATGTSGGSIVPGLAACGAPLEDAWDQVLKLKFKRFASASFWSIAKANIIRRDYLSNGKKFRKALHRLTQGKQLRDLLFPVNFCVSNMTQGRAEVFNPYNRPTMLVADAIYMSCSLPLIFKPIEINGDEYEDGGIYRNFPVDLPGPSDSAGYLRIGHLVGESKPWPKDYLSSMIHRSERLIDRLVDSNVDRAKVHDNARGTLVVKSSGFGFKPFTFDVSNIIKERLFRQGYENTIYTLRKASLT